MLLRSLGVWIMKKHSAIAEPMFMELRTGLVSSQKMVNRFGIAMGGFWINNVGYLLTFAMDTYYRSMDYEE